MAIVRFGDQKFSGNPWADFEKMRRDLDTFFRRAGQSGSTSRSGVTVFPALNISEDAENLYVQAEIPGVPADGLEIAVEGDTLTIRGERSTAPGQAKLSYHRRELEDGRFSRAITLPVKIQVDQVVAKALDGIVSITLPKEVDARQRQIKVNVG